MECEGEVHCATTLCWNAFVEIIEEPCARLCVSVAQPRRASLSAADLHTGRNQTGRSLPTSLLLSQLFIHSSFTPPVHTSRHHHSAKLYVPDCSRFILAVKEV